jgi:hypothetical protein
LLDKVDFNIISLLVTGHGNKQISTDLKIPLSTIQRRTKKIMSSGVVNAKIEPNFKMLGIKKGLLHVYLSDGDIRSRALKVAKMDGILSTSVHVGNSDIVGDFVYEDSERLIDTISNIKHMEGVDRVLWSEEIYSIPVNSGNVLNPLKAFWNNGSNGTGGKSNKRRSTRRQ